MGVFLLIGGMLGFLPVVGFWMIPLGLAILSIDNPPVRRLRRKLEVWWGRRSRRKLEVWWGRRSRRSRSGRA
jgi:hypothetical protein